MALLFYALCFQVPSVKYVLVRLRGSRSINNHDNATLMIPPPPPVVITDSTGDIAAVQALRKLLLAGGCVVTDDAQHAVVELLHDSGGLSLRLAGRPFAPLKVDFASAHFLRRLRAGGGRNQPIARAVGCRAGHRPTVFDATAGLGRDGFLLASLGCKVTLCEESALVFALLADGIRRAEAVKGLGEACGNIRLLPAKSETILEDITPRPETVYLDPMFPQRPKSALVKKEMQALHHILPPPDSGEALLRAALHAAQRRVECKRPSWAPPLTGPAPHHAIRTKKHRFDVWLVER